MEHKNKTRVVVVDDNIEFLDVLCKYLAQKDIFEIVGTATDGLEAVNVITDTEPDIVVLDIMMPKLDGLGVLEKIDPKNKRTQYIVTSAMGNYKTSQLALSLGAEYFMIKPFDFDDLVNRICQLRDLGNQQYKQAEILRDSQNSIENYNDNIEYNIKKILDTIGMPSHLKGYGYIRYATKMVVKDLTLINSLTKLVYADTAKAFNTTCSRVERAIRNAIELTWTKGDMNQIDSIFNYQNKIRPTNSEFIMMVANKILDTASVG